MGRIQTQAAATMLGVSPRTVQSLAAQGVLPGTAKIGKVWTFDPQRLQRYIETQEAACQASVNNLCSGSLKPPLDGAQAAHAYERMMARLRGHPQYKHGKIRL